MCLKKKAPSLQVVKSVLIRTPPLSEHASCWAPLTHQLTAKCLLVSSCREISFNQQCPNTSTDFTDTIADLYWCDVEQKSAQRLWNPKGIH